MGRNGIQKSRFLVVGSGIAGLQFALLAVEHGTVRIVTKKNPSESNTNYAQGGIAAALSPLDDFDSHLNDTLVAGDGLCDEAVTRAMVEAAPRLIDRLLSYGVRFSKATDGPEVFEMGREGGHSHNRILHAADLTGRELEQRLLEACRNHPDIDIKEDHLGIDLIRSSDLEPAPTTEDRIVGCWVLDSTGRERIPCLADLVVLATGGCGKVYAYTSNPDIATGDGMAMAYRAGALLSNMEFVQFHPTCLYHPEAKSFLISEAVRGEGAHLVNGRSERFMVRYHPLAELAPRDVVARAIDQEMKISGDPCVFLDLAHLDPEHVRRRFPNLHATCAKFGVDMTSDPVPVVPAAHYMCGGVMVDDRSRTSLPGLLAIGETACTGVHGANRLASNSLLEAVYFSERAGEVAAEAPPLLRDLPVTLKEAVPPVSETGASPMVLEHDWDTVRRVMWDYVGIVRNRQHLDIALERLRAVRTTVESVTSTSLLSSDLAELRNLALVGELIVLCAIERRESRGLHYTLDHPAKLPGEPKSTFVGRGTKVSAREFPRS